MFRSLASTLIRRTVLVAAFCTLVAACIQAGLTYRDEKAAFDRALANVAAINVPLLSVSVWDIEPEAIRRQLKVIASQPEIAYVRLSERTGRTFEAGNALARSDEPPTLLPIPYPDGRAGSIGALEVAADRTTLHSHVAERVIHVVVGYGLLSLIVCALIAIVLRLDLERPMRELTRFTAELTPESLTRPLTLTRPPRRHRDEIDLLSDGFRTLQDGIHEHVATLDKQVAERTAELEKALAEIRKLTVTDPLTGCFNRRHLDERLLEEVLRCQRSGQPLSLIITDIDHFKRINDTLGHAAGDAVLRGMAELLQRDLRAHVDWVARYGGEEFVIVLPNTALEAASRIAERMRRALETTTFAHEGRDLRITASFGVSQYAASDIAASVLARADSLLYQAKAMERNRVVAG